MTPTPTTNNGKYPRSSRTMPLDTYAAQWEARGSQRTINRTARLYNPCVTVGPLRIGMRGQFDGRDYAKRTGLSRHCSGVKP